MTKDKLQQELERAKRELFTALQSKHSLQHYMRIAYDVVHLPMTLCDTSFGVMAAVPTPPSWRPTTST